jgi:Lhr-like helicase
LLEGFDGEQLFLKTRTLQSVATMVIPQMKPTKFQSLVQDELRNGKSVLLVAPTGLGKTFAVVGDVQDGFRKIVYAVPLRALGGGIRAEVS